jgi:hypothetical protein
MNLEAELNKLACRVIDHEEARTTTHQEVLLILAQNFDYQGPVLMCEPSIVGSRSGAPDIVIVDPKSGLHVVEVKGVAIDQVRGVQAGGAIEISYGPNVSRKDPSRQARTKMFDIKNAASKFFDGELHLPFQSWVIFPRITRRAWENRFGEAVALRPDVIFSDDLESSRLKEQMQQAGLGRLATYQLSECPPDQLRCTMMAFGDDAAIEPPPRPGPKPKEGTKGEQLDEEIADYRALTDLQKRLTKQVWDDGPRLLRGVAGSGKTVVMATQVAKMIKRLHRRQTDLFAPDTLPKPILAVCFNRTLVPFIRQRIEFAYKQLTGDELPKNSILVTHFNALLYGLHSRGYCGYYRILDFPNAEERADKYLSDLQTVTGKHGQRLADGLFHAVYVDEGQDFHHGDYKILLKLCNRPDNAESRLFVFYDDAQNLYGRKRPTWSDLGLELRGRSVVMDECFRNTRQIVEPAFNMLLGSHTESPESVKTRAFADIPTLQDKGLIKFNGSHAHVRFSNREGEAPTLHINQTWKSEDELLVDRCEQLMAEEGLLPHEILVLAFKRDRAAQIATALATRLGHDRVSQPFLEAEKDDLAIKQDRLTVSTVASAKGYDAPFVLVASIDEFTDDIEGRASLYVACTRAREWLQLSAVGTTPLVSELQRTLSASMSEVPAQIDADYRDLVRRSISRATSWDELQAQMAQHGLEYFERGGGLAIRRTDNSDYVCKASEVGPAYSKLIKKFGEPFPDHSHDWLAERVLRGR